MCYDLWTNYLPFPFSLAETTLSSYRRLRGENERNEQKKGFNLATKREPKLPVIADYKWFSFSHWTTIDSTSDTIQRLTQAITSLEVNRRIVEFLVILTTAVHSFVSFSQFFTCTIHRIISTVKFYAFYYCEGNEAVWFKLQCANDEFGTSPVQVAFIRSLQVCCNIRTCLV